MTDAPRPPVEVDFEPLADLFTDLWGLAHAHCTPDALKRLRTRPDFLRRLRGYGAGLRVVGRQGAPLGFVAVVGDELEQLYVHQSLWGTGMADLLVKTGLEMIRAAGYKQAIVHCNPGNDRAARYYRRSGWQDHGLHDVLLPSSEGPFALPCLVFKMKTSML